jgi:hypothetical protein
MTHKQKNTGLFQLSAIALDNGFILWDSTEDGIMETTIYKCLMGIHAGEVITVVSDYLAGTVREVEYDGHSLAPSRFEFEGWELKQPA